MVEIKDRADNFVGLKNTEDDIGLVTETLRRSGTEKTSLPMLSVSGCGMMISVSNIIPDKVAQLCDLYRGGDADGARQLNDAFSELFAAIGYDTSPITTKYMPRRIGIIPENEHRLPMTPSTPELERRLDAVLDRAGFI